MRHYHGISLMYDDVWTSSDQLNLWTDSSDIAIGCVYKFFLFLKSLMKDLKQRPIVWEEMYAIHVPLKLAVISLGGKDYY